ncbi:UDP-N-acetylmuramoyl-L-alanyl-D-glutamate--2,6-diaminopimelate ligase [Persicimonas caeni]|nr:UDP-N-acetylmuramoyl-L-alanyl-D-glutamate--2,6-diaminopimelate ligase [Persicimonas caeni]
MKLSSLLEQIDEIELASGRADDVDVCDVAFDSREVGPGTLFVALRGANVDGHRFVEAAADAGAAGVLVDRDRLPFEVDCPVLTSNNTRATLGAVGAAFYEHPSSALSLVGVTGTNGKTTTTWMLESLFLAAGRRSGLIGTIGYRWGEHEEPAVNTTPESLVVQKLLARMREARVTHVAMEVSSHGLSTHRLRGTRFDAAIFTNLTQDHLDFHGDMDAYRRAKVRLFDELLPASARSGKSPTAIVNMDDEHGKWFADRSREQGVQTVTFGLSDGVDWQAREVEQRLEGSRFLICGPHEQFAVEIPLLGDFNVSNALAAAVAARTVGLTPDEITAGFGALGHVPGRMQRVEHDGQPTVFVDYAHTPDALERALATLRPLCRGRLMVVFGCGGDRDRDKRAPMGRNAVDGADLVVVTSDNPRTEEPETIISQILEGVGDAPRIELGDLARATTGVWVEPDRAEAIRRILPATGRDDVVLIAGKGHETYQEIGRERVAFDDVEHVRSSVNTSKERV